MPKVFQKKAKIIYLASKNNWQHCKDLEAMNASTLPW